MIVKELLLLKSKIVPVNKETRYTNWRVHLILFEVEP